MEQITDLGQLHLPEGLTLGMGDLSNRFSRELLAEAELKEFNKLRNKQRKNEFLSSRYLIKNLAGEIGLDSAIFEIHKDGLGKPFGIYYNQRYNLSLAHTGDNVLCCISESIPVGVDMEPVDRKVDERLRARMLHPDEKKHFGEESLIRIWTLKEAMVKLEGKGLRTNLNQLRIYPESDTAFTGKFDDEKSVRICSFQYHSHWIAVAYYL